MSESGRKLLLGLLLWLAAGAFIGWLYGRADWGLLLAAILALAWQVRRLLLFDRALHTGDFDEFRLGDGIWQQMFSRFRYLRQRGDQHKNRYWQLLREIRASTDAMPDGAVILDANDEILLSNRAAKTLAGLKRKKDRGQYVANLLRDPALIKLLTEKDYSSVIEIPSPVRDGHWLNCRVVPYGADQKLLLLRDVTERVRLQRMRRDFVANASHELRSPLTVISGYLDSLAEDVQMPGDWTVPVTEMQRQAHRMNQIVSELIALSRLESAGPAPLNEIVDVTSLMQAVANAAREQAPAPEILIECDSAAQLRGNASEIQSVISNLLSNAIRHTPQDGSIRLIWRATAEGGDLIVRDTGEGIAAEHIPRLTERFFRVDRGRSRDDGGVGLGLSIVKHVLGRHDAELHVDSEPGLGSEFRCHFRANRIAL